MERETTYSIERSRTSGYFKNKFARGHSALEGAFRWLFFDSTTAYGKNPGRALVLIMALLLLCVPIYCWSIVHDPGQPQQVSGIYQVFPKHRIEKTTTKPTLADKGSVVPVHDPVWWSALGWASYFSLLSATNIGFQQFTPGDWIGRLQSQNYTLQAEGWVRAVAGAQALLSVYLLAISVLTYLVPMS